MKHKNHKIFFTLAIIATSSLLSACAPILLGSAVVGTAVVYTDRRPANVQSNDKGIQIEILSELKRDNPDGNIEVAAWNRRVLIVGSVPNAERKQAITNHYAGHPNITHLFNELNIGFTPAIVTKASDGMLTARIRSSFIATQGINSNSIKIVSEGTKVYLLGWVTQGELEKAVTVARQTKGVSEVVNLTEIVGQK